MILENDAVNSPMEFEAGSYEDSIRRSGFGENWNAALGLALSESLPVTSRMMETIAPLAVESRRRQLINDYHNQGLIPSSAMSFFSGDTKGLAKYASDELGLEGFVSDEDYEVARQAEYKGRRDYSASVFQKADGWGVAGQIAGNLHAMPLDPLYAASMLTGYGTASTIGQAVVRGFVIDAGMEALAQPSKMAWADEIKADYSGAQAFTEVLFAGLGGGVIAGLGKGLSKILTPKDLTVEDVVKVAEKMTNDHPELSPVLNTLRRAEPGDNLWDTLHADEAIDIRRATEGPLKGLDPKADPDLKVDVIFAAEEKAFTARQPFRAVMDDRVNLSKPTPKAKLDSYKAESGRWDSKVKSSTKKAEKAKAAAAKLGKHPAIKEDSVAGRKAKAAFDNAVKKAEVAAKALEDVKAKQANAKALYDEATASSVKPKEPEGVPRGTPKEAAPVDEPDVRHPMVKEADDAVLKMDEDMKVMEECF